MRQMIRWLGWGGVWLMGVLMAYYIIGYPNFLRGRPAKVLIIAPGTDFNQLQEKLVEEGFISHTTPFSIVAHVLGYSKKVLPGAYQLMPEMSNFQVIRLLRRGTQHPIKIVLHNLANKEELAVKITENIQLEAFDFQMLLEDSTFLASYGFNIDNVLAMFIPNTYEVYWMISARDLFKRMYREYQKFWDKDRVQKAQAIALTPIQVYILASIVAKETNTLHQYPIIAGVYINRLKRNMLLQACPTALYASNQLGKSRKVLYSHIHVDSPYNTYRYKGLPPGPITMPSIAAIDAVLNYQSHDYLYFVLQDNFSDNHYFSTTFKQHQYYVKQYKKTLTKKNSISKE